MTERVLITGGNGFIGVNLCRELEAHGRVVRSIDLASEDPRNRVDASRYSEMLAAVEDFQPDTMIHLAAQVGRINSEDDIAHTINANAAMTANIARICGERGIRLVYTSTSEIYGDHGNVTVDEYTSWALPHNLYGLSKRWGEEVSRLYAPKGLVIIRPSMPYGPGAPPGRGRRAMDNMLHQALHGKQITVHRGSERSWCWAGDLVSGMRLAMEQPLPGVYNVGRDDDPRTMLEIAQMACRMVGASEELIVEVDPPSNVTPVKRLSTKRLRSLGWEPTVELEEGMELLFGWIKHFDADGTYVP